MKSNQSNGQNSGGSDGGSSSSSLRAEELGWKRPNTDLDQYRDNSRDEFVGRESQKEYNPNSTYGKTPMELV